MLTKLRALILSLLLGCLLLPTAACAHKVSIFAYVEDGIIYTESYFSDGKPVEQGRVLVYDNVDNLVLEGRCDKQGMFQFAVPKAAELLLVIEAGLGHRGRYLLRKSASKE